MARPTRHNADYYTHNADLRNDRRVKAIRTKFGTAGYGLLHMILETLTDADHTQLDTDPLEIELLAGDFGVSATEIHELLQFGESIGYFQRNAASLLICHELNKWLEPVFEKRNRTRNTAAPGLLSQAASETGVSVTVNPQSKVEKRREEKSKACTETQPASQPASSFKKKGIEDDIPFDQSSVYLAKDFFAYLDNLGYPDVEKGMYLLRIQTKAQDENPRTDKKWKAYIQKWLDNDKNGLVLLKKEHKSGEQQSTGLLRPKNMQVYR